MSSKSKTVRRSVVVACSLAVVAALIVWFLGSGSEDSPKDAGPTSDEAVAATEPTPSAATPDAETADTETPGGEPSSGPTRPPSLGSLDVVPVEEATTEPPVPLTATADFGTGLTLKIMRIESVKGVARGPGEVAGPALRLTLRMWNRSDSAVSLESAVVDATTGDDRTSALTLTGPGARAFQGEVPAGGAATAVYVFAVPEEARDRLRVAVSYVGGAPVVVLVGAVG